MINKTKKLDKSCDTIRENELDQLQESGGRWYEYDDDEEEEDTSCNDLIWSGEEAW